MKILYHPNSYIDRLEKILNFDLSDKAPAGTFLFPDQLSYTGVALAILATPVVAWCLYKLKRYGWMGTLLAFIILPYLLNYFLVENVVLRLFLTYSPLVLLVIYYTLLKSTINDWRKPIFINTPGSDNEPDDS
ncbi:MAG: hypothetical protein FH748_05115 [Balneolaceae bacterium]|nr:hypothetical protein [Balneolaceae bacterium]